jgi:superfamily II DNA or RNA helicase
MSAQAFQPGTLVRARGREWVVLPETKDKILYLRPLGGGEDDATVIYLPLERKPPEPATFAPPDPAKAGSQAASLLLRDALKLKLRAGAGPFRSFGNLTVEPRAYQLVPLLMALKLDTVRLLVADDVGVGKTIEAGLIARELLDRGEIGRMTVVCPPHLCEQWKSELATKFNIQTEVVRTGTASRLERGLPAGKSIFDAYPFTVVSLDYIKSDRRRDEFLHRCPEFVIVEEAHTCVQGNGASRHQRYQLLKGLASDIERHMVLLTATPHSGDEEAFYNLLSLLDPRYQQIRDTSGEQRDRLRQQLASHFVQRRRPDIAEWKDATVFPDRQTKEITYALTGEWGWLFKEVLAYARGMVKRAEGKGLLQQRMNWWAALALLRCVSSSPAAATNALRTRLTAVDGVPEDEQLAELERQAADTVLDGESDDLLSLDEAEPAGRTDEAEVDEEDTAILNALIDRAEALRGAKNDPKLAALARELEEIVDAGFTPVVFCRYIATAHYVAEHLRQAFAKRGHTVIAVTGELTPEEREEKVDSLEEFDKRILVATDCMSEGINLQRLFDAAVHYDLSWNPTRHEQREGRVDRFGQPAKVVRALMLYGENNPVDGAVLRVILRKAERIRKELGITVPMPEDSAKVMQAVMEAVLLRGGGIASPQEQMALDLGDVEERLEQSWQSAKEKARQSQTIFAQRRLRPDDVLPEWRKAVEVLGSEGDVERLVKTAVERLGAPLERAKDVYRLPVRHLPLPLRERLEAVGIGSERTLRLTFSHPAPAGAEYVHRAHPLVATLAEYITERALAEDLPDLAARSGAIFTKEVATRTIVYLLRLRSQISVRQKEEERVLLSEECLAVAHKGSAIEILGEEEVRRLMAAEPARNMEPAQRQRLVQSVIDGLPERMDVFDEIARQRASDLLADHRRVRTASEAKGLRYDVTPCLPVDVIGIYVLMPAAEL